MSGTRRFQSESEIREAEDRQSLSLAGLAVTLAVLVAGLYLVQHLAYATRVEDCLLALRMNCDKVAAATP